MKLPPNKTEAEVLEALEKVVTILARKYTFGIHDAEDIKQQGRQFGLECLERYDPARPLENFLYSHINNRLFNFKRNHFRRNDPPCLQCHAGDPCKGREICSKYEKWLKRNNDKASLAKPKAMGHSSDEVTQDELGYDDVATRELLELIDKKLSPELRLYYLQLRDGLSIPKAKREALRAVIGDILSGGDNSCPNADA